MLLGYLCVGLSSQQCPVFCVCDTTNGILTVSCNSISSMPTITDLHKGIILNFIATTDIPKGAFKDLTGTHTITITGKIGKIETGAFDNIAGGVNSEIRFSGSIATIEANAFTNITGINNLTIDYLIIDRINSFALNTVSIPNIKLSNTVIGQVEPYAFENVNVVNTFEVFRTDISLIQPCGFGGVFGPTTFQFRFSTINTTEDYAFGGIQQVLAFLFEHVTIKTASATTLMGMNSVNVDADIANKQNTAPVGFAFNHTTPNEIKNNIREMCFNGYVTTTSTTTTLGKLFSHQKQ